MQEAAFLILILFFFSLTITDLPGQWGTLRQGVEYLHQLNKRHPQIWRLSGVVSAPVSREQTMFTFHTQSTEIEREATTKKSLYR